MTQSKELLTKITALRVRLDRIQTASDDTRSTPIHEATHAPHFPRLAASPRLTFRAAQLLKECRGVLAELKVIADDPLLSEIAVCQSLERESAGVLDVLLRNLLSMPEGAAAQLRHCEGLQTCLTSVRGSVRVLRGALDERRRDERTIDELASLLHRLSTGAAIDLGDFLTIARELADAALQGSALRFGRSPRQDVARFAASHGLAVARTQAWVLRSETPQRQRLAELLVPALIHDVGMLIVPEEIAFKRGPLDDGERALIQEHPLRSRQAADRLYPGGGWPVDAIADHHERLDGTGYPTGKPALALGDPARLLAACDVYAALVSHRSYRPAADPRTALADTLMLAESGLLDRAQTEKLMRLTFYPAGSVVMLSDGAIALVVGTPKAMVNPAKATVIPLRDADGASPAYPWPIDLAESVSLSILRALTAAERAETLGRTHPTLV